MAKITQMMACGHASNGTTTDAEGNEIPCCIICMETKLMKDTLTLDGRHARCCYYGQKKSRGGDCYWNGRDWCRFFPPKVTAKNICSCEVDSNTALPFFKSTPDKEFDEFYCGCGGWD